MQNIFGQDIALTPSLQAQVAADGTLVLTNGPETGEQDIFLRLFTPLGELFYDVEFGSRIHLWVKEENSLSTRLAFEQEVTRRLRSDPRVQPSSAACEVVSWDEKGITAKAVWTFISETHQHNLIFTIDAANNFNLVVKDVRPRS